MRPYLFETVVPETFFTGASNDATVLRAMPKTSKNSFQKVCFSADSEAALFQSLENLIARYLISFQARGMVRCARLPKRRLCAKNFVNLARKKSFISRSALRVQGGGVVVFIWPMHDPEHIAALNRSLGRRLRYYREARKLSQERLAEIIRISTRALQEIESGQSNPSWITVLSVLGTMKEFQQEEFIDGLLLDLTEQTGIQVYRREGTRLGRTTAQSR
jgi:DNA-binding XRE family transcriptional regulator